MLYDANRPENLDLAAHALTFRKLSKAVMSHMEVVRGEREKKKSRNDASGRPRWMLPMALLRIRTRLRGLMLVISPIPLFVHFWSISVREMITRGGRIR